MSSDRAAATRSTGKRASEDTDQLISVAAAEPDEWGWLTVALLDWLAGATPDTVVDFGRFFAPGPTREHGIDQLHHIAERIAGMAEQDRCRS